MLTFNLLLEDYVTRGQVGSGWGRAPGALLGGLAGGLGLGALTFGLANDTYGNHDAAALAAIPAAIGAIGGMFGGSAIGGKIGSKLISNPDAPADFGNKWHRWGYVNDEGMRLEPGDILSSYNTKQRQANALRRMGYDNVAIQSAINPGFNHNGVPNATPQGVALTEPSKRVVNK